MKQGFAKFSLLFLLLTGLPLLGVRFTGQSLQHYFEFPPMTHYVEHAPFSWIAFLLFSVVIFLLIAPIGFYFLKVLQQKASSKFIPHTSHFIPFPSWGWFGILLGITFWILAWNRFPWFSKFQTHTFTPLWIAYILVISALTYRRSGKCMLLNQTGYFLDLFPLSAIFWWFFEYLNRFVQNWYYVGIDNFSSLEYFWFATLAFSTVLPAVLGTREYLATFSLFTEREKPAQFKSSKSLGGILFLISCVGLAGIGIWPNILYPLLWVSPLLILTSFQMLLGEPNILSEIISGNRSMVLTSALAALICGFFWEMWNYYSFAKWIYAVPYVNRFHIFEMPLLGYAGYLPFGLECLVISNLLTKKGAHHE